MNANIALREDKWYSSIQDVLLVLTGSSDIKQYIKKLKSRDPELSNYWGTIYTPVEMIAADGKKRKIQAAKEWKLLLTNRLQQESIQEGEPDALSDKGKQILHRIKQRVTSSGTPITQNQSQSRERSI